MNQNSLTKPTYDMNTCFTVPTHYTWKPHLTALILMVHRLTTLTWYNLDILFLSLQYVILFMKFWCKIPWSMQHTADGCDLVQSAIRNDSYKKELQHGDFSKKIHNKSDYLLFAICNIKSSFWFVIMSFNVHWLKDKSSNCWKFWLNCEDLRHSTTSWMVKGQIFLPLFEAKCLGIFSSSNYTKKLPFINSDI
jgi:hypothetical protein